MVIDPSSGRAFRASNGVALDPITGRPDPVAEALRPTSEDRLYTLEDQVEFAVRLGFGNAKSLGRLHHKWREVGVLWRPDRRQSRKGGAGLWNQDQVRLWLECLRRQRNLGTQGLPRNLAAIPVGLWLWGRPGVPLDHARRAFHTRWTAYLSAPLAYGKEARKSRKRKAIAAGARRMLARNPGLRLLEELRSAEPLDGDESVAVPINKHEFIGALVEGSARPPNEAQLIAQGVYGQIAAAALALTNLKQLCFSDEEDWPNLWEWARLEVRDTWWGYATEGHAVVPGDFYDPSAHAFLEGADRHLLMVLGIGLNPNPNSRWPDGIASPPRSLPGLRTN